MSSRARFFSVVAATTLLVVGIAVAAIAISSGGSRSKARSARTLAYRIPAFVVRERTGEHGREAARGGETSPAREDYENLAYPRQAVAVAQTLGARADAQRVDKRAGAKLAGPWKELGPTTLNVDALASQSGLRGTQWSGRVTAMAVDPKCDDRECRLYVAAAGGGVWRANNALAKKPDWKPISDAIPSNSIGSLLIDPSDPTGRTLYAGTGEANNSSDSEAGIGLYRSTDRGDHWSLVPGSYAIAKDRGIDGLAVDPLDARHILVGTGVDRHGMAAVWGGRFTPPGAPPVGLYESTDGGATFSPALIKDQDTVDPASASGADGMLGGVTQVEFDPNHPHVAYVALFGYGLWRSNGAGGYEQAFALSADGRDNAERASFALANRGGGRTRIYLGDGHNEITDNDGNVIDGGRLWRVDDAGVPASSLTDGTANPGWTSLSDAAPGTPGFGSFDYCQGQCDYDSPIASPAGRPDTVWIGGQEQYGELGPYPGADRSNGRTVMQSTDAGASFTDMSGDARDPSESMHPDQHAIAFVRTNPDIAFLGSDGGVIRTSGAYADASASCDTRDPALTGADLVNCRQWLAKVPTVLTTLNAGLATLQFQSVSASPTQPLRDVIGGTQDNGTMGYTGTGTWLNFVSGDGGQSGIDVDGVTRYHLYTDAFGDVNFHGNDPQQWDWFMDPLLLSGEGASFYAPLIADPKVHGTAFVGAEHVWRTKDSGGDPTFLDAHCRTYGGPNGDLLFTGACGDWEPLGANSLTSTAYGTTRGDQFVAATERAPSDTGTLWAATRRGRVFVSKNADASAASAVTFTRIDDGEAASPVTPTRFVSSISIDAGDPNHAIVSYSGYSAYTPTTPGHVFDVRFNPATGAATWKDISGSMGDQPVREAVLDPGTGDIYASTDWGINRLPAGQTTWLTAAKGLPPVAVYGMTLTNGKKPGERTLYAATHGRGVWRVNLPEAKKAK